MKKLLSIAAASLVFLLSAELSAAESVTKADLQAIMERLAKLEAENKAQAARIAELEGRSRPAAGKQAVECASAEVPLRMEIGTTTNETGNIFTTESGRKYFLADKLANIFEPLSESGLQIVPYGYLAFEGVYNSHAVDADSITDFVKRHGRGGTTLSMQDSLLGVKFNTPEASHG